MEERRNGEAMEKRLQQVNEMIEVLAGAVLRVEKRCDDLELWTSGVDESMPDERIAAIESKCTLLHAEVLRLGMRLPPEDAPSTLARVDALERWKSDVLGQVEMLRELLSSIDQRLDG